MSASGTNQVTAITFHGMNDRSAIVTLSPTRYFRFDNTISRTPNTRLISLLYLSTALGIFSAWKFWNHADWPKYGLHRRIRDVPNVQVKKVHVPLARDLEGDPLQFDVLILPGTR